MQRFALLYSAEEIAALRRSVVSLAGLGGYGSALVDPLARYELAELRLADSDRYERGNMDRQALAKFSTLGCRKTEVAREIVADATRRTRIVDFENGVASGTVHAFCCGANVVIDACDSLAARLLLRWECSRMRIALVMGGARSWPSRFGVRTSAYRYDRNERFDLMGFPFGEWGIRDDTWRRYCRELVGGNLSLAAAHAIDVENARFRDKNPPPAASKKSGSAHRLAGGYDPLKIMSVCTGFLEETISILIGRRPRHHLVERRQRR